MINVFVDIHLIYCEAPPSIMEPIEREVNTFFNHKSLRSLIPDTWGKFPATDKYENMQGTNMFESEKQIRKYAKTNIFQNEETNPACFIAAPGSAQIKARLCTIEPKL